MRLLTLGALAVALLCSCHRASPQPRAQQYATRDGQYVKLRPSGVTFRVPQQWLEWYDKFHNNLHLTRGQLDKVENGDGEWDTEYGRVVNAALPFADCAAHVGGEGWGLKGTSFGDVQLRAYVTNLSPEEIVARLNGVAFDTARRVSRPPPTAIALKELAPDVSVNDEREGRWRRVAITYPLWYGDYGGVARIRFYIASIKEGTLVLVFMGGEDQEVQSILDSVSIQKK
jgi:hypothetical protein